MLREFLYDFPVEAAFHNIDSPANSKRPAKTGYMTETLVRLSQSDVHFGTVDLSLMYDGRGNDTVADRGH